MANYYLRNPDKIIAYYGDHGIEMIQRMYDSLDHHFKMHMAIRYDIKETTKFNPYPQIIIDDLGHTCALIAFYVVKIEGFTYRLAFKEFIG